MSLVLRLPGMTPAIVFENGKEILQISLTFAQAKNHIIPPAKSGPRPSEFNTFDLRMCFAPQLRALFNDSTSKSAPRLIFAPQRGAPFEQLTCQVLRTCGVFSVLAAHFFNNSMSQSAPKLRCFSC